jgi:RNase P subunit RPR2
MNRRMKRFVCPQCKTSILKYMDTQGKLGAKIQYFCQKCDVIWDAGLRTADD